MTFIICVILLCVHYDYTFYFSVPFDTYVQGNVVLDQSYDPKLDDRTSQEYLSLEMSITTPVQNLFCDPFQCCSTTVTGFRQGSVIAGILVAIASNGVSKCDISSRLISQMSSLPATIGGIPVSPGSLSASKSAIWFIICERRKNIQILF